MFTSVLCLTVVIKKLTEKAVDRKIYFCWRTFLPVVHFLQIFLLLLRYLMGKRTFHMSVVIVLL